MKIRQSKAPEPSVVAIGSARGVRAARLGRYVACSLGGRYLNNGRNRLGLYLADGFGWNSASRLARVDMRKERLLECALVVVTAIMQFIPGFKYGHN